MECYVNRVQLCKIEDRRSETGIAPLQRPTQYWWYFRLRSSQTSMYGWTLNAEASTPLLTCHHPVNLVLDSPDLSVP